jgi:flavorubredoxin
VKEIRKNIYYCGITDADRKYFDELIPLENGTSYNAYLVCGSEKTALIDTSYPPKIDEFLAGLGDVKPDYIIANHGEQDHTGAIPVLLEKFPNAVVLTNPKCKENIVEMLLVPEGRIKVVADGEEISLGDKTLKFIYAPGVHWPDTMFTHLLEDNLLFTCDFLGAHQAFDSAPSESAAKRYYAEIMMPFAPMCGKYVRTVRDLAPAAVLPSHGPMYDEPETILRLYDDWAGVDGKNLVLIPYVSMYGSTKEMADYVAAGLEKRAIKAQLHDVVHGDLGELAIGLVDATSIVIGAPMVLAGPHPMICPSATLLNILRPKVKYLSFFGSFGWGGDLFGKLISMVTSIKPEIIEPVLAKGKPKKEDFAKLDALINSIAERHTAFCK